ncbi:MAG: OsmC family protein [Bacteriovoracaceae bacterium]
MIRTSIKTNLSVTQTNGEHTITADVGKDNCGDDSALSPHELLEASLGACTTITVLMYARRKQWRLKDVVTTVKVVSEKEEINEISREIQLIGDIDQEQKERLMEIANKCPMHKFLSKKSSITTKAV